MSTKKKKTVCLQQLDFKKGRNYFNSEVNTEVIYNQSIILFIDFYNILRTKQKQQSSDSRVAVRESV